MRPHLPHRTGFVALAGSSLVFSLAACGGGGDSASQVASLGADNAAASQAEATVPVDSQQQWIDFAQCMRDNGVDMQEPTFDADGNVQGGFGPDSGIDMRADDTRTAMDACGELLPEGGLGTGGGRDVDRTAIQATFTEFTSCLRDEGLEVDDIDFAAGPGGERPDGQPANGGAPEGEGGGDGGGFQDGPPPDQAGGEGFDPTARIMERLGLDTTDPAVTTAVDACSPILDGTFDPNAATTSTQP